MGKVSSVLLAFLLVSALDANSQVRKLVAVLAADRSLQNNGGYRDGNDTTQQRMSVEEKLVVALISRLASNPNVTVLDRSQTDTLVAEQDNKMSDRFDASSAVKLGKLQGVDTLIFIKVEGVDASAPQQNSDKFLYNDITVSGIVHISATANAIAVDTGSVIVSPSSLIEKNEVIRKYKEQTNKVSPVDPNDLASKEAFKKAGFQKIVLAALDDCAKDLDTKLAPALTAGKPKPTSQAKVVGIEAGKVMVNHGTSQGFKVGDKFQITRVADSGFKDPDTGQAIVRKKNVCELVLTEVEDAISLGNCAGDAPEPGDPLTPVAK